MKFGTTWFTHKAGREHNEDALLIGREVIQSDTMEEPNSCVFSLTAENFYLLFAVADGMGGYNAGEIASRIVLENLRDSYSKNTSAEIPALIRRAHSKVVEHGLSDPKAYGLGSTLAGLFLMVENEGAEGLVFNVGDSRVYRRSGAFLQQISEDQTVGEELLKNKLVSEEEIRANPRAKHLTESVGGIMDPEKVPKINLKHIKISQDDFFLICSDGVTDMLDIDALETITNMDLEDPEKMMKLFQEAIKAGGTDNMSIIFLQCLS